MIKDFFPSVQILYLGDVNRDFGSKVRKGQRQGDIEMDGQKNRQIHGQVEIKRQTNRHIHISRENNKKNAGGQY